MNGTHLRGKLLELRSVILLWFYPYLREFLERLVTTGSCASCLPLFLATGTKVSTAMTACSATRGPAPPMLALSLVTLRNTVLANSGLTWRPGHFGKEGVGHLDRTIRRRRDLCWLSSSHCRHQCTHSV